jgi:hypothetical protein
MLLPDSTRLDESPLLLLPNTSDQRLRRTGRKPASKRSAASDSWGMSLWIARASEQGSSAIMKRLLDYAPCRTSQPIGSRRGYETIHFTRGDTEFVCLVPIPTPLCRRPSQWRKARGCKRSLMSPNPSGGGSTTSVGASGSQSFTHSCTS